MVWPKLCSAFTEPTASLHTLIIVMGEIETEITAQNLWHVSDRPVWPWATALPGFSLYHELHHLASAFWGKQLFLKGAVHDYSYSILFLVWMALRNKLHRKCPDCRWNSRCITQALPLCKAVSWVAWRHRDTLMHALHEVKGSSAVKVVFLFFFKVLGASTSH